MCAMYSRLVSDPDMLVGMAEHTENILPPLRLEHDPRWLAFTDHGEDARGLLLALHRDADLVGYVPLRQKNGRLPLRIGEVRLASLPYRMLQLFGYGVLGREDDVALEALRSLARLPLAYDAMTLEELPTSAPLFSAISDEEAQLAFVAVEQGRAMHHVVELPSTFPEYLERFTSKRRNGFRRAKEKIAAELGAISLSVFVRRDEMRGLLETIGPVAKKTFQYRLFGQDLTVSNTRLLHNLETWAEQGWVRAYVLKAGGDVLAYVIGFLSRGRYFYETVGYDPSRSAYGPGSVLLLRILEDLVESRVACALDFGAGDADYKKFFGTASWEEANMFLVRRTLYARSAAGVQRTFAVASRRGAAALERLGWKQKVKAALRSNL